MKRAPFSSLVPYLVLGLVFAWSCWHVATIRRAAVETDKVTLRIGHWMLQAGMRESFDLAITDYQKLHPEVSIEQIPVPIRSYAMWLRTRLVGETAPDITGLSAVGEEIAGRYYLPLDSYLSQPNPYNAGTPLEGVPWRDTFVDGLECVRNLLGPVSGELYGVNLQINTLRLYFNRNLLRAVTGSDAPPATFAQLRDLGDQIAAYNARTGAKLIPIASCGPYSRYLFNTLVPSQTQRFAVESSPSLNLAVSPQDTATAFLRGEWSYATPAFRNGLELMREVTSLMPPGFSQLERDDALFAYLQQQAVMFYAGSWDYGVLVRDGPFPTGVTSLPLPDRDDPKYGRFVLGPISEAAGSPEAILGITRTSRHPEVALDFLRFLSSRRIATIFSRESHRISSVVGTPPPPDAPGLAPVLNGEVNGFGIDFTYLAGGNTNRAFQNNLYRALGPKGDLDDFIKSVEATMPENLRRDLAQAALGQQREIRRLDSQLAFALTRSDPKPSEWSRLAEAQSIRQQERLPLVQEFFP